ncbi:ead/Ea22-like family protein, partial [Escherichia coli]
IAAANPATVLSLLDELEAVEKRIAELSASHSKLREGMAAIYNAICENGASTSLSAILTFVKRSREESATAAGIGVKGE